jgi:hypothetical protein
MAAKKSSSRKYGKAAGKSVKRAMHKEKRGTLKSGSGRKVTSRKQAIAIGLSEAREAGAKVPSKRTGRKSTAKKGGARKKSSTKKSSAKKSTRKRSTTKKSSAKKSSSRKKSTRKRSSKRSS